MNPKIKNEISIWDFKDWDDPNENLNIRMGYSDICLDCGENTPEDGFICDECKIDKLSD